MARLLAQSMPQHLYALANALEDLQSGRHSPRVVSDRSGIRSSDDRPLSPLVLASAIADRIGEIAEGTLAVTSPAAQPDLLVPILAGMAARLRRPLRLQTEEHDLTIGSDSAQALAALKSGKTVKGAVISALPRSWQLNQAPEPRNGGIGIADDLWRRFDALAALTYVPASAHSRLAGAGAGLSDND
jgi:hypothetical protein